MMSSSSLGEQNLTEAARVLKALTGSNRYQLKG